MAGQKWLELPAALARGAARFARWREGRAFGKRIPESLWSLAKSLAARYGVSRTAKSLRVEYYALKKRCEEKSQSPDLGRKDTASPTAFVELAPAALATLSECVIEFEKTSGAKLRVHLKGHGVPDLAALGRGFWEAR